MTEERLPEPWLGGTLSELPVITRALLHSLQLAEADAMRWCGSLSEAELNARPADAAPVAFHLRHIARSLDRLLTYAEDRPLKEAQLDGLKAELDEVATREEIFAEFRAAIENSARRVKSLPPDQFGQPRYVGERRLPTTLGGLLIHIAEHTQRHVGQAITTARIVGGGAK